MYFDTHAHYDHPRFDTDRKALLESLPTKGIRLVLNPGYDMRSSRLAVGLSDDFPFLYAAVGFHPHDSQHMETGDLKQLESLTRHPKVVAVGEIGLDYHYNYSPREIQREVFRQQMDLARRVGLPVIIHQREAATDTLEVLGDYPDVPGVVHCFSGSLEVAKVMLNQGLYLSFTGVITYKNARKSHEIIRYMPQDRLLLETDAPYMAPEPHRGKRNSSQYLPCIASVVADLWSMRPEEVGAKTTENGKHLFGKLASE